MIQNYFLGQSKLTLMPQQKWAVLGWADSEHINHDHRILPYPRMLLPTAHIVQNNTFLISYFFRITQTVRLSLLRDYVAYPSKLTVVNNQVDL